jgi:hypothetical protein
MLLLMLNKNDKNAFQGEEVLRKNCLPALDLGLCLTYCKYYTNFYKIYLTI